MTGSSRGIGKAIALAFARKGANIVLNGRGPSSEALEKEIQACGVEVFYIAADIQHYEEAKALIHAVKERFGTIDVVVNNAGITNDKLIMRMTEADFMKVINVNLKGTFNVIQNVSSIMLKQRSGTIINLSSVVGLSGNSGQANYAASKAGVVGLTKSVARELASRGITCNAIAPGFITTDMTNELSDKVKENSQQQIPLKRFGSVEDVANTAIFLAKSPYITGQVINVDGGMLMNG